MTEQDLKDRLEYIRTNRVCEKIGVNPKRIYNWMSKDRVKIRELSKDELARFDRFFNETLTTRKKK